MNSRTIKILSTTHAEAQRTIERIGKIHTITKTQWVRDNEAILTVSNELKHASR